MIQVILRAKVKPCKVVDMVNTTLGSSSYSVVQLAQFVEFTTVNGRIVWVSVC